MCLFFLGEIQCLIKDLEYKERLYKEASFCNELLSKTLLRENFQRRCTPSGNVGFGVNLCKRHSFAKNLVA